MKLGVMRDLHMEHGRYPSLPGCIRCGAIMSCTRARTVVVCARSTR